jgi:ketosteroid isomerase-like protein
MGQDNTDAELVRRFWDALYSRDWPLVRTFFDERSQYWDVPTGPEAAAVGPEDIEARLLLGLEPLAGYHHEVAALIAGEGVVVTEHAETWEWHTGESVTLPFVSMMRLRDGVIGRWTDYWNMPTLMDASPAWWQERLFSSDLAWVTDLSGQV